MNKLKKVLFTKKMTCLCGATNFKRQNWMVRHIAHEKNLIIAIELLETKFSFIGKTDY